MKEIFLVDMDETLLDFQRAERENLYQTLSAFDVRFDDEVLARFHAINDSLWKALERGEIAREPLKVRRFELLFAEFGFSGDVAAVARAYWTNFPNLCFPFEGATDFLRALKRRGRIYLVTNGGTEIQKKHIALAGFSPYLDGVFISEEIGCDKPSAEYADYVEAHIADYERSRAIWIGDSLTSDGRCAENRGIDFLLFAPRGVPEGYAGKVARTYEEALRLIETLD